MVFIIKNNSAKVISLSSLTFQKINTLNYDKLELFVSKARLGRYLRACGNSKPRALELYKANLLLAEAYYPILNYFEIFFRNALNRELIRFFNDPKWIITEKNGFMSHRALSRTGFFIQNSVIKAENSLNSRGRMVTPSALIAEQTFGFWSSFFEAKPFGLLKASILNVFPLRPSSVNRASIRDMLNEIRDFRNRIYHNEPICFDNHHIDFSDTERIRLKIYLLLSWVDSDLENHVKFYDRIPKRLITAKRI